MIIATAGHVDHGKTTLVHALTGVHTDRLAEEQRRGLTIDLGFAYGDWDGHRWGFVDVPGHARFIGNMLAGVAAIDLALLVVAADSGPMPQTLEHLQILDLLEVDAMVVALTRADLAATDRLERSRQEVAELLAASGRTETPMVPVAAPSGQGIDLLRRTLTASAESSRPRTRNRADAGFRLAVDRVFSVTGSGLVVTGSAHAGSVKAQDQLLSLPDGRMVRVRGLRALDRGSEVGEAGERLALNVTGIDRDQISRGDWLVEPGLGPARQRFDARLRPLPAVTCRSGQEVHLYHGASHSLARITLLEEDAAKPRVHISTREPLGILHGDRFILRDSSGQTTLAGGRVLDPDPPARGRRRPERLRELDALEQPDPERILLALLACHPFGLDLGRFARSINVPTERLLAAAPHAIVDRQDGLTLRDPDRWRELQARIIAGLADYHRQHPQLAGMGFDQVLALLQPRPAAEVLRCALRDAIAQGSVMRSATRFHLPDHEPRLTAADAERWQQIRHHFEQQPRQPPVVHDLARTLDCSPEDLDALLTRVSHSGQLTRVAPNRLLRPAAVTELAHLAERLAAASSDGSFEARGFRDAAGIGRNLTIDLLEYFDRQKLTRRHGNLRRVVAAAESVFGPLPADSELAAAPPPG